MHWVSGFKNAYSRAFESRHKYAIKLASNAASHLFHHPSANREYPPQKQASCL